MDITQQRMLDNTQTTHYFSPRQLLFLVEHDGALNRQQVNSLIKWSNQAFDDVDLALPHRILSFSGAKQRKSFSLIFTKVNGVSDNPADLLRLLERLEGYLDESESNMMLRAVSPNWLGSRAPQQIGTGGPGAIPIPAESLPNAWHTSAADAVGAPYSFKFKAPHQKKGRKTPVEVAILDTAPCHHDLVRAYHTWHEQHPLIRSLLRPGGTLRVDYANHADLVRLAGYEILEHHYEMADHGLFVAGIVHSLVPQVQLRLIEVLNPYGVGDVESIALGLQQVLRRRSKQQLVVNASLVVNIPQPHEIKQLVEQDPTWGWLDERNIERMRWPLEWICDALQAQDVQIVAAAGNDAVNGHRPPARYPAAFNSVIGVGALEEGSSQPTNFSNLVDTPIEAGIATFGGGAMQDVAVPDKGMLGIYIGDFPKGEPNKTGWAWWAGTSFATPVIAGSLATLINQGSTPDQALQDLRSTETATSPVGEDVLTVIQG